MESISVSRRILTKAVQETIGEWTGADWTHTSMRPHAEEDEMCEGGNDECASCAAATLDAAEAESLAKEALKAIDNQCYLFALELITECEEIERTYGDTPLYGGLGDLAKNLIKSKDLSARLACHQWIVPPENQGQIVEVAYAQISESLWKREYDRSCSGVKEELYQYIEVECPNGDACNHAFRPYNAAPECDMFEYKQEEPE